MKKFLCAALISLSATSAGAHSPLKATTPGNAAVIAEAPRALHLAFRGTIRLTRVSVIFGTEPSVDLDLSGHKGFVSDYSIPFQSRGDGNYIIEWRGLGSDGHAMKGSFQFEID